MDKKIKNLLILLLLPVIIYQSSCTPKKISKPDEYQYPYYKIDLMCQVIEFHPEYMKIIDFVEISTFGEKMSLTGFRFPHPVAFWDRKDVYDIQFSGNVESYDSKLNNRWKKQERYKNYDYINYEVNFKKPLTGNKNYSFWISYKTKRLPHLHTKEQIGDNKNINFGMKTGYSKKSPKEFIAFAIPSDSKDLRVVNYYNSKDIEVNAWKLYYYDLSMCIVNDISLRIGFSMGNEKEEPDIEDIVKNCKELKENYK